MGLINLQQTVNWTRCGGKPAGTNYETNAQFRLELDELQVPKLKQDMIPNECSVSAGSVNNRQLNMLLSLFLFI